MASVQTWQAWLLSLKLSHIASQWQQNPRDIAMSFLPLATVALVAIIAIFVTDIGRRLSRSADPEIRDVSRLDLAPLTRVRAKAAEPMPQYRGPTYHENVAALSQEQLEKVLEGDGLPKALFRIVNTWNPQGAYKLDWLSDNFVTALPYACFSYKDLEPKFTCYNISVQGLSAEPIEFSSYLVPRRAVTNTEFDAQWTHRGSVLEDYVEGAKLAEGGLPIGFNKALTDRFPMLKDGKQINVKIEQRRPLSGIFLAMRGLHANRDINTSTLFFMIGVPLSLIVAAATICFDAMFPPNEPQMWLVRLGLIVATTLATLVIISCLRATSRAST